MSNRLKGFEDLLANYLETRVQIRSIKFFNGRRVQCRIEICVEKNGPGGREIRDQS